MPPRGNPFARGVGRQGRRRVSLTPRFMGRRYRPTPREVGIILNSLRDSGIPVDVIRQITRAMFPPRGNISAALAGIRDAYP